MHPRNGTLVRPLLSCRRLELRDYLAAREAGFVEDESNADLSIPRNRIRGDLLPRLRDQFNPQIVDILAHEAELARETWQWLEGEADRLNASGPAGPDGQELDIPTPLAAPPALRRFVVWQAMSVASRGRAVSFDHVEAALHLMKPGKSGSIDAPGHRVQRIASSLVLTGRPEGAVGRWTPSPANLFEYSLSIPGEVPLPLAGCALSAEIPDGDLGLDEMRSDEAVALVRRDLCGSRMRVRNRRPGDSFRPLGLGGRKKLQDFFVDRKVARQRRDTVPLVVDERDRIVWVAGFGIDEAFRVTDPAQAVLILRLKLLGGPA